MASKTAMVLHVLILHFHFSAPPIVLLLSLVTKLRRSYHCLSHVPTYLRLSLIRVTFYLVSWSHVSTITVLDQAAAWRSGNSDGHSNQVTLRQARLVQGWVTIFEQAHSDLASHPSQLHHYLGASAVGNYYCIAIEAQSENNLLNCHGPHTHTHTHTQQQQQPEQVIGN